jgi:hypothetical protein
MNRKSVGGVVDLAAMTALTDSDDVRMKYFKIMTRAQQEQAIRGLAAQG